MSASSAGLEPLSELSDSVTVVAPPRARVTRTFAIDSRPLLRSGMARTARRALNAGAIPLQSLAQAAAALQLAELEPELILLGLQPGDDVIAQVAAARAIAPVVVCVLDTLDGEFTQLALEAEADGYLLARELDGATLNAALDQIRRGRQPVAEALLAGGPPMSPSLITDRCREVLLALADGLHDHEIAGRLGISTSSVRKHVASAQERLDARTRTQAVAHAARLGLL